MKPCSYSDCFLKWGEGTPQSALCPLCLHPVHLQPRSSLEPGASPRGGKEAEADVPFHASVSAPSRSLSGSRAGGTCDEVAEFRIETDVIVCAVQPDHTELTGNVLRHGHVVHGREEGGRLIVHIQH